MFVKQLREQYMGSGRLNRVDVHFHLDSIA